MRFISGARHKCTISWLLLLLLLMHKAPIPVRFPPACPMDGMAVLARVREAAAGRQRGLVLGLQDWLHLEKFASVVRLVCSLVNVVSRSDACEVGSRVNTEL